MKTLDDIPLSAPQMNGRRFTQSQGQLEYVACKRAGLDFAASGHQGQWLYSDGKRVVALYPNGDKVSAPFHGLHWITEAQKL
jgi:hypothetical protein